MFLYNVQKHPDHALHFSFILYLLKALRLFLLKRTSTGLNHRTAIFPFWYHKFSEKRWRHSLKNIASVNHYDLFKVHNHLCKSLRQKCLVFFPFSLLYLSTLFRCFFLNKLFTLYNFPQNFWLDLALFPVVKFRLLYNSALLVCFSFTFGRTSILFK